MAGRGAVGGGWRAMGKVLTTPLPHPLLGRGMLSAEKAAKGEIEPLLKAEESPRTAGTVAEFGCGMCVKGTTVDC